MTDKERAAVYRELADGEIADSMLTKHRLRQMANELDPPRPEPGENLPYSSKFLFVRPKGTDERFRPALMQRGGIFVDQYSGHALALSDFEWKPARIAGPMQELVDIPPVREWPVLATSIHMHYYMNPKNGNVSDICRVITRAEAERREAGQ